MSVDRVQIQGNPAEEIPFTGKLQNRGHRDKENLILCAHRLRTATANGGRTIGIQIQSWYTLTHVNISNAYLVQEKAGETSICTALHSQPAPIKQESTHPLLDQGTGTCLRRRILLPGYHSDRSLYSAYSCANCGFADQTILRYIRLYDPEGLLPPTSCQLTTTSTTRILRPRTVDTHSFRTWRTSILLRQTVF